MLPGFRFLFAAIVLSMSVLIFGLGAAALLRAAHEQFASTPSRRAPPEPVFARQNEPPMPTLALLRFEPAVAEKVPDNVAAAVIAEPETTAPTPEATPAEPEKLAALKAEKRRRTGEAGNRRSQKRRRQLQAAPVHVTPTRHRRSEARGDCGNATAGDDGHIDRDRAGGGSALARRQYRRNEDRNARRSCRDDRATGVRENAERKAGPQRHQEAGAARERAPAHRGCATRRLLAQQAAAQQQANPFDPQATRARSDSSCS